MEVEKTEERPLSAQLTSLKDFQHATQLLWDQHVRTELIYGKKLRYCRTCSSFYYEGEPGADHPPEDTEAVQHFFQQAGISTVAKLANFLWANNCKVDSFPPSSGSFFSTKHQPRRASASPGGHQPSLAGLQARAHALQLQVAELVRRLEETEMEKQILQRDNEEIMGELLRTRTAGEMSIARIQRLTHQISSLCNPIGCCCGEPARDSSN